MIGKCDVFGCLNEASNHIAREGGFDLCRDSFKAISDLESYARVRMISNLESTRPASISRMESRPITKLILYRAMSDGPSAAAIDR